VTLRVEDTSTALPVLGSDGRIVGGYDLDIIGRLVETWGFSRTSTGRQVWALLTDPATATERTDAMAQARPARGRWPDLPPGTSRTPRRAVMNGSYHPVAVDARVAAPAVLAERLVELCDSVIGHMLVAGLTLGGPAAPPPDRTRLLRASAALEAALRELRECTDLVPNLEPDAAPAPRTRTVPEPQRSAASRRSLSLASDAWRC
jgi:hypothetical protein